MSVWRRRERNECDTTSLAEQYPRIAMRPAWVRLLLRSVSGDFRQPLYILFGAVTAVLLIAARMSRVFWLARGFARRHEFGVRVALGARPSHIVRQVLIESTVLACCAGYSASPRLVLRRHFWDLLRLISETHPCANRRNRIGVCVSRVAIDGNSFGVVPAWSASRWTHSGLWRAGRGSAAAATSIDARMLVIAETAVSLNLLLAQGSSAASCKRCESSGVRPSPSWPTAGNVYRRVPREKAPLSFGSCCRCFPHSRRRIG